MDYVPLFHRHVPCTQTAFMH